MFGCLSSLFRHLVRQLAADLAAQLARTARLRYHRAEHVRQLAARSAGFLFRHAGNKSLRAGVRAVFAGERTVLGLLKCACPYSSSDHSNVTSIQNTCHSMVRNQVTQCSVWMFS